MVNLKILRQMILTVLFLVLTSSCAAPQPSPPSPTAKETTTTIEENISFLVKSDQQMFFTYFKNLYLAKLPGDVDGYQPEVTPKPSTTFAFGDQICVMMDLIKPIETGNLVETIYDAQTKKVIKYVWPVIPFQANVSHKDCFTVAETCSPIMVNDLCLPAGNNEIWISFDGNTAVLPFSIKH